MLLAELGWVVDAVDRRTEAIDCIRSRFGSFDGAGEVTPITLDLASAMPPNHQYSLILMLNVLHFLPDARASLILHELCAILDRDGLLWIKNSSEANGAAIAGGYAPDMGRLRRDLGQLRLLHIEQFEFIDDHPPEGIHTHSMIEAVATTRLRENGEPRLD